MHEAMRQHQSNFVKPTSNAKQVEGEGNFSFSHLLTRDALAPAITSLVLDGDHELAFTGDEIGYVCMWQLGERHAAAGMGANSTTIHATQLQSGSTRTRSTEASATDLSSASVPCRSEHQCSQAANANGGASTSSLGAHRLEALACWRAHKDAVSSLSIIRSDSSPSDGRLILVSASLDSTARAWAIELAAESVRLCGGLGGWELPVVIPSQFEREDERLKQLAEDMECFKPPKMPQKAKHLLAAFGSSPRRASDRS
eukprot:5334236-Pleurochrysis_carterae.AAC.3